MPPRNHLNWTKTPNVEYISSECYNNAKIFDMEQEHIFSKVWVPVFHKSELSEKGNFRTGQIAGQNILAYNDGNRIKCYKNYNVHQVSGTMQAPLITVEPELYCEVKHGGMVWTTLDPNPTMSVEELYLH